MGVLLSHCCASECSMPCSALLAQRERGKQASIVSPKLGMSRMFGRFVPKDWPRIYRLKVSLAESAYQNTEPAKPARFAT
jgi:hypothetical protein